MLYLKIGPDLLSEFPCHKDTATERNAVVSKGQTYAKESNSSLGIHNNWTKLY